jgi:predicted ferric reductase
VANLGVIVVLWVRGGGLEDASWAGVWSSAGRLTALLGTFLLLAEVVLAARVPWLDHVVGSDRLLRWHRWTGFGALWLLVAHVAASTVGWASAGGRSILDEAIRMIREEPDVLAAWAGFACTVAVAATSIRAARRRLAYETWYFVHLYSYLGLALAFGHQVAIGSDLALDPLARAYWIGLYALTAAGLLAHRVAAPTLAFFRHRLRVSAVVPEAPGVVSIHLTGRALERFRASAGQFVRIRFLTREQWWKPHPLSFSASPNDRVLRVTFKALGDGTRELLDLRPGVRALVEGPYGAFTDRARRSRGALLIGGGVGIAPIRALFETIDAPAGSVTVLYRAHAEKDVLFRHELDGIARDRGFRVEYAIGPRSRLAGPADPFAPRNLGRIAPGLAERDAYVCGPRSLVHAATRGLRAAGVPPERIHAENFDP